MINVKDYFRAKDFDVVIRRVWVCCESDRESDCEHVVFVLADPNVIKRAHKSYRREVEESVWVRPFLVLSLDPHRPNLLSHF